MIKVEAFEVARHYKEIESWWKTQGWDALPPQMLPFGYVALRENLGGREEMLAAAFVIGTDGALHVMEWIVGNPSVSYEERGLGIDAVVSACLNHCKERGASAVITTTKHERLIERYKKMGFLETDTGMTHLVIPLYKKEIEN